MNGRINRPEDRPGNSSTDRQTEGQKDRWMNRQTDKDMDWLMDGETDEPVSVSLHSARLEDRWMDGRINRQDTLT